MELKKPKQNEERFLNQLKAKYGEKGSNRKSRTKGNKKITE